MSNRTDQPLVKMAGGAVFSHNPRPNKEHSANMWFKNACIYSFTKPVDWTAETLEAALSEAGFQPCGKTQPASMGWTSPTPQPEGPLAWQQGPHIFIALRKEERILPASVVKEELAERVAMLEEKEGRKLRKKEKDALKEELMIELYPRAFTRQKVTRAWIDTQANRLVVDTATPTRADEFTGFLRQTLGSLPIQLVRTQESPVALFTAWLREGAAPAPLSWADQAELRAEGDDTVIRVKGAGQLADAVQAHLEDEMVVTRLALNCDDRIACVAAEDLKLRAIKPLQQDDDAAYTGADEDPMIRFDADVALMTAELGGLINALIEALGGEDQADIIR
ncbi:MAG: recombination-associated protein RdgC [Gammaproteobacteria bacterium]|nr:MAG: recombination-associated protein RdgC [Gammaproteobacteria bacterium]